MEFPENAPGRLWSPTRAGQAFGVVGMRERAISFLSARSAANANWR